MRKVEDPSPISSLWWTFRGGNVPALLVVCVVGFLLGVLGCDNRLSAAVRALMSRVSSTIRSRDRSIRSRVSLISGPVPVQ